VSVVVWIGGKDTKRRKPSRNEVMAFCDVSSIQLAFLTNRSIVVVTIEIRLFTVHCTNLFQLQHRSIQRSRIVVDILSLIVVIHHHHHHLVTFSCIEDESTHYPQKLRAHDITLCISKAKINKSLPLDQPRLL
jgi:hypothetical protein